MIIGNQIKYMLNKDLGYEKEQMLIINRAGAMGVDHIQTFKQEIGRLPGIIASTNSTMMMGHANNTNAYMIEGQPFEHSPVLATNWIDFDYAETYGLELVEGRFLSPEMASDSTNAVVNEAAVRAFNLDDPLSLRLIQPGRTPEERIYHQIVGVVKDFHFESLHSEVMPYIFIHKSEDQNWGGYITVRLKAEDISSTMKEIEKTWKEFTNNQPFEYSFMNDNFAEMYSEEVRTGKIFRVFSLLAILVACMGLLGLSSYTAEQRTKEIGIRKVMGANVPIIIRLLSKEIIILVLIATIISVPATWYFMGKWLESFAYRVNLSPLLFVIAIAGTMIIALITVASQAITAAMRNPADSLRYE
jgi:putative ABC transport system permease protein